MEPPKCKSCGVEEWRHTCGPIYSPEQIALIKAVVAPIASRLAKAVTSGNDAIKAEKRKEYLKIKARERRARQKAEMAKK